MRPKVTGTGVFMPRVARPASQQQHDAVRPRQVTHAAQQRAHHQRTKHKNKTTAVYMPFGNPGSLYGAAHMDVPVLYAASQPAASQLGPRSSSSDHSAYSHSSVVLEHNTQPDTAGLPVHHSFGQHTSTAGGMPMQTRQEPIQAFGGAPCAPVAMSTGVAAAAAAATQMPLPQAADLSTAYLAAFSSSGVHTSSSGGTYDISSTPGYSIWGPVGQQQQLQQLPQQAQPCMPPAQHMGMPAAVPESCSSGIAFAGQPVSMMTGLEPQTQGLLLGQPVVQVSMPAPVHGLQDMGMQQLHALPPASTAFVGGPGQCMAVPVLGQDVQVLAPAQQVDCWLAGAAPMQLQLLPALGQQLPQLMLVQQ